jgi:hypothetical protein
MPKYYSISVLLVFLISCSEEQKQPQKFPASKRPNFEEPTNTVGLVLNPEVEKYVKRLDSLFTKTPYYTSLHGQLAFYVCNGQWKDPENDKFDNDNIRMGIVNQEGDTLLALDYDKIYNPDGTAKGFIEIERKGKRGLYNYSTRNIFKPEYDVIFPSSQDEIIAFGKKGDDYYAIRDSVAELYTEEIPTYSTLGEKWNFDINAKNINYLHDSYNEYIPEGGPLTGEGVVFTPSYLLQLSFLPEIIEEIEIGKNAEFALTETKGKIIKTTSLTEKIFILFTSFYEEGIDSRGWQINQSNVVTVDSKNNVLQSKIFLGDPEWSTNFFPCDNRSGFNYLEQERMLEVYTVRNVEKEYNLYDFMTCFEYYKINENGEIEKLQSTRFYDFTKYVILNDNHFKGCFTKHIGRIATIEGDEANMWLSNHLTIEDLDLMRNEIYADYGLKFKTTKWQQYFSKQPWYKPSYDNVDHLLTETDKKNLEFILSIREKMIGQESKMTNKRAVMYAPAG